MKPGKYTIRELFLNKDIEQIIIPEIQRDYVWGEKQVENLLNSIIQDCKTKINALKSNPSIESLPDEVRDIIIRQNYSSNIGFIYAYYDKEYPDKYFLIDGQQRLTTIYLLLLAIAVETGKVEDFKHRYFKNSSLKLDYKVREASSEFLQRFLKNILEGLPIDEVEKQFWYFSEYENDQTIQSIIINYGIIKKIVQASGLNAEDFGKFIENFVDFWYFDTNISEQGEELYIYMNSRGEVVQPNENFKAILLEELTELEKSEWGKKWEDWQDFFWKNREFNHNADIGFNEFLKWIQTIETIIKHKEDYNSLEKLRLLEEEIDNNQSINVSLPIIERYISSFKILVNEFPNKNNLIQKEYDKYGDVKSVVELLFVKEWTSGDDETINKINLFPLLICTMKICLNEKGQLKVNPDWHKLYRYARYFYNILRFETVSKTPYVSYRNTTLLANALFENEKDDITDSEHLIKTKKFLPSETILTDEEKFKLYLFKNPPANTNREELEQIFWNTEDHKLNNGSIAFLLQCLGINTLDLDLRVKKFNLIEFKRYKKIFEQYFKVANPLRIRSLLTKGDYKLYDGSTPVLEGTRYSLGANDSDWRKIISEKSEKVKELFENITKLQNNHSMDNVLNKIINDYLENSVNKKNWTYNFVKYPKIFEYCHEKKICLVADDEIYILRHTKATEGNYKELKEFVEN